MKRSVTSLLASVISIIVGLIAGLIVLLCFDARWTGWGMNMLLTSGISKLGKVLYQSAPIMMTGLGVGFAFKTGLFNIGATGQYTVGSFFALYSALVLGLPWYLCLLMAMLGGALWGSIPGLFKAYFNVNEVITSIMFNWIGLFTVNLIWSNLPKYIETGNRTRALTSSSAYSSAIIPKLGLDEAFNSTYMNIGVFIAVIIAIIMWVVLTKTTFGYELQACGSNRNASIYAGINAKRNIVLSMMISGALAGIGGGLYYLSGQGQYTILKELLSAGFDGIPVALLAASHPIGTIFSAIFISYIRVGGESMQTHYVMEIIDIITSVIIYLSAFSLLMRGIITKVIGGRRSNGAEGAPCTAGDGGLGILPPKAARDAAHDSDTEKEDSEK